MLHHCYLHFHNLPVGIEVDTKSLAGQRLEVSVLLHHLGLQVVQVRDALLVLSVSLGIECGDGGLAVGHLLVDPLAQRLVLGVPGSRLGISAGAQS